MPNAITPLIQQYTVDFASNNNFLFVKGIQGDGYGTRYVDISLMNNGQPYTVNSEAVTVAIRGTKPDTSVIFNECEILDNNTIRVEITQQMSAIAGKGNYEISIISNLENRTLTSAIALSNIFCLSDSAFWRSISFCFLIFCLILTIE